MLKVLLQTLSCPHKVPKLKSLPPLWLRLERRPSGGNEGCATTRGRPSSYSTGDLTGKGEERALFQLRGKAMHVSTRVCLEIIKRVLTSSQFCQTLIWDLQLPEMWEINSRCLSHPTFCGILIWQPDLTGTSVHRRDFLIEISLLKFLRLCQAWKRFLSVDSF